MRLTPEETMALQLEFPGCGLTVRNYFDRHDSQHETPGAAAALTSSKLETAKA